MPNKRPSIKGKGADFSPLKSAARDHVSHAVLIGRDAKLIEAGLENVVPVTHASGMADAVAKAQSLAKTDEIVLLSPACASFDMFKNFAHRGEVYCDAVRQLSNVNKGGE